MKLEDAFYKLSYAGVTSSIQQVRKWVREGKIEGTMERKKDGYVIDADSLDLFIEEKTKRYERYFRMKIEKEHNINEYKDTIKALEERLEIERGKNKIHRETIKKLRDE